MDLGSGSSPQKALCLKPRPSRYAATCGRASWSATCRRAARRGPPGRPVVSGCQWHPSGLETVSNTRPCIGSFALVDEKSCVRTPHPWHRCQEVPDRPNLTGSALGTEPVKHARAMCTATRHLPPRRRRLATLTRSTNSRATRLRARSTRGRDRGSIALPAETKRRRPCQGRPFRDRATSDPAAPRPRFRFVAHAAVMGRLLLLEFVGPERNCSTRSLASLDTARSS